MRWLRLTLWVPLLLLLVGQNQAQENATGERSPAVPITAKQRQLSYRILPDGSRVLEHQQEGAYYRSWSGATMNSLGDLSTFIDDQGNVYTIVHRKKFAQFEEQHPTPLHEMMNRTPEESILGYETVDGFHCAVLPVLLNGQPAGKESLYLPYGLEVKTEFTEADGAYMTVRELYDIEVAEPDPALLRIPEGYAVDSQSER